MTKHQNPANAGTVALGTELISGQVLCHRLVKSGFAVSLRLIRLAARRGDLAIAGRDEAGRPLYSFPQVLAVREKKYLRSTWANF